MAGIVTHMFTIVNIGLITGLVFGGIILLRPALMRVLSPQQRVVLWGAVWVSIYIPSNYPFCVWLSALMPISFRGLLISRAGQGQYETPNFLPGSYAGPGDYHLALPGGGVVPVTLDDGPMWVLLVLWVAGGVAVSLWMWYRSRRLKGVLRAGRRLSGEELMELIDLGAPDLSERSVAVWVCPGLDTSFIQEGGRAGHEIYLQEGLTSVQTALILRHEMEHVYLWHCRLKAIATIALVVHWWDPLIWLGYRYFCRDLELACDAATLSELDLPGRRAYAHALVDLGTGRQLWEMPLSFGECDVQMRVRQVARWRPRGGLAVCLSGLATMVVLLFFLASPTGRALPQDVATDPERSFWDREAMAQCIGLQLPEEDRVAEILYDPGQIAGDSQCRSVLIRLEDGRWLGVHCENAGDDTVYLGKVEPLAVVPEEGQLAGYAPLK